MSWIITSQGRFNSDNICYYAIRADCIVDVVFSGITQPKEFIFQTSTDASDFVAELDAAISPAPIDAPTMASATPTAGSPIDHTLGDIIIVTGTNFKPGATFEITDGSTTQGNAECSPAFQSDTEYRISVISGTALLGMCKVTYTGPDSQTCHKDNAFEVS